MTAFCQKSDDGKPCRDEETGDMCARCQAYFDDHMAYWRTQWAITPLFERDPDRFEAEMRDAGREHLLPEGGQS